MSARVHEMPFGASVMEDGRVRFRLWAPGANRVDVMLSDCDPEHELAMQADAGGWFTLLTDQAAPDSAYQYRIDGGQRVPDPASRRQLADVHGPSQVINPADWDWQDTEWRGRPWAEAVIYELHVGSFTDEGSFQAIKSRLDALVELGVTAIELMPVADFPGTRNWGYDGVLPFAPAHCYGTPNDLKDLIQTAHAKGMMVFLDVVYNHFGPEGNYLHTYAPAFFTDKHHTPWGAAINYDDVGSEAVRKFFIDNALYWLEEFHFDGLRLDAVHAILDDTRPDILVELAEAVHAGPGKHRHVHLVLENDANIAHYLQRRHDRSPRWYVAQWNDDIHHALHVLATGENGGYYADYADQPIRHLGRCLTEGFAFQGEASSFRNGERRGEPSAHLPSTAFVSFMQNHDQVGNRAFGERLSALTSAQSLHALSAVMLLAPSPPLLFMGQEWAAAEPFMFFCDFGEDLAAKVTEGRRKEFERFPQFSDPNERERIPDPNSPDTFRASKPNWTDRERSPHAEWLALHRELLQLRHAQLVPHLEAEAEQQARYRVIGERALAADWIFSDGYRLSLFANLGDEPIDNLNYPGMKPLYRCGDGVAAALPRGSLPARSVVWFLGPEA